MVSNTFWKLAFILMIATTTIAHSKEAKASPDKQTTENQLKEVIQILREENAILRKQVQLLQQRDVESDIAEIREILKSYGEDITNLRINQGHINETVLMNKDTITLHSSHLSTVDATLLLNAGQLSGHDSLFIQHQTFMDENRASINSHTQTLGEHQGSIQANLDGINYNAAKIQENLQFIQSLSDNYNNYRNSQVKFYAETGYGGSEYPPENSRIYYPVEHLDTHNALDNGQFIAPYSGIYGFTFSADFRLYDERSEPGWININVNEGLVRGYLFDSHHDDEILQDYSITFYMGLNQGDRLDLSTSQDPVFDVSRNPAYFMGFLVHLY